MLTLYVSSCSCLPLYSSILTTTWLYVLRRCDAKTGLCIWCESAPGLVWVTHSPANMSRCPNVDSLLVQRRRRGGQQWINIEPTSRVCWDSDDLCITGIACKLECIPHYEAMHAVLYYLVYSQFKMAANNTLCFVMIISAAVYYCVHTTL